MGWVSGCVAMRCHERTSVQVNYAMTHHLLDKPRHWKHLNAEIIINIVAIDDIVYGFDIITKCIQRERTAHGHKVMLSLSKGVCAWAHFFEMLSMTSNGKREKILVFLQYFPFNLIACYRRFFIPLSFFFEFLSILFLGVFNTSTHRFTMRLTMELLHTNTSTQKMETSWKKTSINSHKCIFSPWKP